MKILAKLSPATCRTSREVTCRVVANGQFEVRASSGHPKVKLARCYNLDWDGTSPQRKQRAVQLSKPASRRKTKKESAKAPIQHTLSAQQQEVESEPEEEPGPPQSYDALKTLSTYNLHPWESLNLTTTSGSNQLHLKSTSNPTAPNRINATAAARVAAGIPIDSMDGVAASLDSRSYLMYLKTLFEEYPGKWH